MIWGGQVVAKYKVETSICLYVEAENIDNANEIATKEIKAAINNANIIDYDWIESKVTGLPTEQWQRGDKTMDDILMEHLQNHGVGRLLCRDLGISTDEPGIDITSCL